MTVSGRPNAALRAPFGRPFFLAERTGMNRLKEGNT